MSRWSKWSGYVLVAVLAVLATSVNAVALTIPSSPIEASDKSVEVTCFIFNFLVRVVVILIPPFVVSLYLKYSLLKDRPEEFKFAKEISAMIGFFGLIVFVRFVLTIEQSLGLPLLNLLDLAYSSNTIYSLLPEHTTLVGDAFVNFGCGEMDSSLTNAVVQYLDVMAKLGRYFIAMTYVSLFFFVVYKFVATTLGKVQKGFSTKEAFLDGFMSSATILIHAVYLYYLLSFLNVDAFRLISVAFMNAINLTLETLS